MSTDEILRGIKLLSRLLEKDLSQATRKLASEKILKLIELL